MSLPYPIEDDGGGGGGDPPDPSNPPTQPGTTIALLVVSSNVTITADQIVAAGGPWAAFKVRVTPINDVGSGTAEQVEYPA